jgi:hypothetical protein
MSTALDDKYKDDLTKIVIAISPPLLESTWTVPLDKFAHMVVAVAESILTEINKRKAP